MTDSNERMPQCCHCGATWHCTGLLEGTMVNQPGVNVTLILPKKQKEEIRGAPSSVFVENSSYGKLGNCVDI